MKTKKHSAGRFALGMLIYAVIVLGIAAAGLTYFSRFLADYESTRTDKIASDYLSSITLDDVREFAAPTLDQLNTAVSPREECEQQIYELLQSASIAKVSKGSTDTYLEYAVTVDGTRMGKVYFAADGESKFGFTRWKLDKTEYDFISLARSTQLTIPSDWSVSLGGWKLDDSCVTDREVKYSFLEPFYGNNDGVEIPYMISYDSGLYFGERELRVTDAEGNEHSDLNEEAVRKDCPEEMKTALEELSTVFVKKYINFSSNSTGMAWYNYTVLRKYMIPNSNLDVLMTKAVGSLRFASSRSDLLESIEFNGFMQFGDYYVTDATYTVTTVGSRETITTVNNVKLIITEYKNELKVVAMSSY